jgi:hypothetical protein
VEEKAKKEEEIPKKEIIKKTRKKSTKTEKKIDKKLDFSEEELEKMTDIET